MVGLGKGNPWLRSAICEAAWAASHTKKSYFHAQYARICARRGPKRALMAVAHSMIIVGFYLIKHDLEFKDLGADFFDRRNREHVTPCGKAVKCPRLQGASPRGGQRTFVSRIFQGRRLKGAAGVCGGRGSSLYVGILASFVRRSASIISDPPQYAALI
jgi:hypothetical protein